MNQRQLASTILIAGTMNVLVSLVLLFGGSAGGHSIEGVNGKKVLITIDQEKKAELVAAKNYWCDSSDFHAWVETLVDPVGADKVPSWKVVPVGVTIGDDLPQWKLLNAIALKDNTTKNTLTVCKNGYYKTFALPDDEATGRAIIQRELK